MKSEPYFPVITPGHSYEDGSFDMPEIRHYGATIRDEFAKAALNAIITKHAPSGTDAGILADAELAYRYADAMLIARGVQQQPDFFYKP